MANSIAYIVSKNSYPDAYQADLIGAKQGTRIVYATTSTLTSANILYADSRLTQPIYGEDGVWYGAQLLTDDAVKYALTISDGASITVTVDPAPPGFFLSTENNQQLITEDGNYIILN